MRVLIQRVLKASVSVSGHIDQQIGPGVVALVGVARDDDLKDAEWLASKTEKAKIFDNDDGRMGLSLADIGGEVLCISQFTLLGELKKGSRPNFLDAAPPDIAEKIYEHFVGCLRKKGVEVKTGVFGAKMVVEMSNNGPVTVMLER